jgi:hypothetical protein
MACNVSLSSSDLGGEERLTRHHVVDSHRVRINIPRQHTQDQIAIGQHADRLFQLIALPVHDQKSDVPRTHQLRRIGSVRFGSDRNDAALAVFTDFHEALCAGLDWIDFSTDAGSTSSISASAASQSSTSWPGSKPRFSAMK